MVRMFQPEAYLTQLHKLIQVVFNYPEFNGMSLSLSQITETQVHAKMPILLISLKGFDCSFKVDSLSKSIGKKCHSIAIGDASSLMEAEKAILQASKTGNWVLLKNIHLQSKWLVSLEKKVYQLTCHDNFRLFMTMEMQPIPSSLVRSCYKMVFEPPSGVKQALQRSYQSMLDPDRTNRVPELRAKVHFLAIWLHAVIIERMRYNPIGWSKTYEFNEADIRCCLNLIDELLESECNSLSQIKKSQASQPNKCPGKPSAP